MNLIEQLGGYDIKIPNDECYQYHKEQLETYEATKHLSVFGMTEFRATSVRSALLQYRRDHGIFEDGDKVILLDEKAEKVFVILAVEYGTSYKVADSVFFEFGSFRHATDEEIKAGHRL